MRLGNHASKPYGQPSSCLHYMALDGEENRVVPHKRSGGTSTSSRSGTSHGTGPGFERAQVKFARTQKRQGVHAEELVFARLPQGWKVGGRKFHQDSRELFTRESVQKPQAHASLLVGRRRDHKYLFRCLRQLMHFFFDPY